MADYSVNLTIQSIWTVSRIFLDILIMWFLLYYAIKFVRNNSRTIQIFKGIVLIIVINGFAKVFGLDTVAWLSDMVVSWGFLAIIIIFVPEIRSVLERLGKSNVFSRISTLTGNEKEHLVDEVVKAAMILSKQQTGALICIEQGQSLQDYVKTGISLNSVVSTELITSLFVTSTPLHDGAIIIQGDRIACASAYFPPTNLELPSRYGSRHRAAIGISEITDSVTVVVSEETGGISIADGGKIIPVDRKELHDYLMRVICNEETELSRAQLHNKNAFVLEQPKLVVEKDDTYISSQKTEEKSLKEKLIIKKQTKTDDSKKGRGFGVFKKKDDIKPKKTEEIIKELEEEESNMKMPHKKSNYSYDEVVKATNDELSNAEKAAVVDVIEIHSAEKPIETPDNKGGEQ